ncbi:MAG: cyclic nucleotide-binding domain-containing protein, partial [Zwartia sp.]
YWLFTQLQDGQWLAPWNLNFKTEHLYLILELLPSLLIVSFVGLITILLSVASLELNSKKEFELDKIVRAHGATSLIAAIFGGFVGIISISRTTLNQSGGGGKLSGVVASLICLAFFLGAGVVLTVIPKAALGGLILFLGIGMFKQWLWDQRHIVSKTEFAQILLILFLVAQFGYLYGFVAGIIISCLIFVYTYSQIGLAFPPTDLSEFPSTVVRAERQVKVLKNSGKNIAIFRLNGYVFFGSASKIEALFKSINIDLMEGAIIDLSHISGIDRSAIGVFQRMIRRYAHKNLQFYLVFSDNNRVLVQSIASIDEGSHLVSFYGSLDSAIEYAEEELITKFSTDIVPKTIFHFTDSPEDSATFQTYCTFKNIPEGEVIVKEGDVDSGEIYFLESGEFRVSTLVDGDLLTLAKVLPGSIVGEISFYTHGARSATISALSPSRFYTLTEANLAKMRKEHPLLAAKLDLMVITKLSNSLQRADKLIATLVRKPD